MKYYEFVAWSCRKPFWLIFTTAASVSIGCCFTAGTSREHSWFPAFLHSSVPRLTVGAQIPQSLELRRQSVLWMNWLLKPLQQNPVVPPTLLSVPSPHGTPPAKGPEKSHQVLPPLRTQHDLIIFTILNSPGYGSAIVNASPTIAKNLFLEGWI